MRIIRKDEKNARLKSDSEPINVRTKYRILSAEIRRRRALMNLSKE